MCHFPTYPCCEPVSDITILTGSRPLLVFVDGRVHLGTARMVKDEELRSLLRKRGYRILELCYDNYSDNKRDQLYRELLSVIRKEHSPADLLLHITNED